ncbi:MAG TPA: metallophosphoesterase family protein [Patescibacteria group bacterium]|nr:metallophosphoesterase family protein [Patescibacteria group bacterium]
MVIAIISDIHDNLLNLKKCLDICLKNKITKLICCGDVGNLDTLKYISTNFLGEIFLIDGNAETYSSDEIKKFTNINYQGLIGYTKIDNFNIGFCHKSIDIEKVKKNSDVRLDYIFYGHSHKPWLEKQDNIMIVNPGNIAGIFYQATFTLFDTQSKNLKLQIINSRDNI